VFFTVEIRFTYLCFVVSWSSIFFQFSMFICAMSWSSMFLSIFFQFSMFVVSWSSIYYMCKTGNKFVSIFIEFFCNIVFFLVKFSIPLKFLLHICGDSYPNPWPFGNDMNGRTP